jgi:hypothetical protein
LAIERLSAGKPSAVVFFLQAEPSYSKHLRPETMIRNSLVHDRRRMVSCRDVISWTDFFFPWIQFCRSLPICKQRQLGPSQVFSTEGAWLRSCAGQRAHQRTPCLEVTGFGPLLLERDARGMTGVPVEHRAYSLSATFLPASAAGGPKRANRAAPAPGRPRQPRRVPSAAAVEKSNWNIVVSAT